MLFFGIAILVIVCDQLTKLWIVHNFALYETLPVVPGFFQITYLTNTGAAFGLLAGHPAWWRQLFFVGVAIAALIAIGVLYRKMARDHAGYVVALALICGGAIGNLIDRIRLGSVIDFLYFSLAGHYWPAFNVADSAITIGVGLFLLVNFKGSARNRH